MPDCKRETANALPSLCIVGVEPECLHLSLSNYKYYLIETAMMKERRYIVSLASFRRHFAASMSILIGRNLSTVGDFGTYIL